MAPIVSFTTGEWSTDHMRDRLLSDYRNELNQCAPTKIGVRTRTTPFGRAEFQISLQGQIKKGHIGRHKADE